MEDNGVKVREAKEESQVKKSAEQIRDKKQDIKFDVRDYPINYLVSQYEKQEFYIPLEYQRNRFRSCYNLHICRKGIKNVKISPKYIIKSAA